MKAGALQHYGILAMILVVTFIVYYPALSNGLLSWDDDAYIKDNPLVYSIDLQKIFSQFVWGNYHPLTILTIVAEYRLFGLNATGYHAVNVFLHLLNVVLVFLVVGRLSEKTGIALVAALLFGIHPIHVESVAWVAELKDLLYTFFFLAAYYCYLQYLKKNKSIYYFLALSLFLLSLLSKAMAASLPVVLILTDYFRGRKLNARALLEKVPFFVLAAILGVVAVIAQKTAGAITGEAVFSLPQRMAFACYGFLTYLYKLVFPLHLSAFYPYPVKSGETIPFLYYAYSLFFLAFAAGVVYSLRFTKKIFFGIGFFAITVFLVLQLLPVGGAIMADRYAYIPSVGIIFLAAEGCGFLWGRKLKWLVVFLLAGFSVFFSVRTYERCRVWKDDMTLWNDVIMQYQTIPLAYYNRGVVYMNEKEFGKALEDYNRAIELNPNYAEARINRGNILRDNGRFDEALVDFNKTVEMDRGSFKAYFNRGNLYSGKGDFERAVKDYDTAITLKPDYKEAYGNRGNAYRDLKRYEEALADYNRVIVLEPGSYMSFLNRGILYAAETKYDSALADYDKAIELNPDAVEAYVNRGNVFFFRKSYEEAISNYSEALRCRPGYPVALFYRGLAKYYSGKKEDARPDLERAASLGYQPAVKALSGFNF